MADVALYFDGSGFGGTAGPEDDWAAVVGWQAGLGEDQYPALGHLIGNGWEDDLPALETDIEGALKDNPPPGAAKGSLEEFLSVLKDRAEGDSAVAITLNGQPEPDPTDNESEEHVTVDLDESVTLDDAPLSNARKPSRILDISPEKACLILKDGSVRGKELTSRQRGLFGVICGRRGKKPTGNSAEDFDPEELDYELAVDELSLMAQDGELPAEEFVGNDTNHTYEQNAGKGELTGGSWVTVEGRHVYVKGGEVVAGPPGLKGKSVDKTAHSDSVTAMGASARAHATGSAEHHEAAAAAHTKAAASASKAGDDVSAGLHEQHASDHEGAALSARIGGNKMTPSDRARGASALADKTGRAVDHDRAADAHSKAARAASAKGDDIGASLHEQASDEHASKSMSASIGRSGSRSRTRNEELVGNEMGGDDLGDVAVNLMDPMPQTEPYGTPTQYTIAPSAYTTGVKGADEASGRARVDSHLAMDKAGHRAAAKSHLKAAMAHLDGAQNVVAGTGSMSMPQLSAHLDAARQHVNAARVHAGNCGPDQSI